MKTHITVYIIKINEFIKINIVVIYPFINIVTFFMGGISFHYIKYRLYKITL